MLGPVTSKVAGLLEYTERKEKVSILSAAFKILVLKSR
jgi:hypothetical protein